MHDEKWTINDPYLLKIKKYHRIFKVFCARRQMVINFRERNFQILWSQSDDTDNSEHCTRISMAQKYCVNLCVFFSHHFDNRFHSLWSNWNWHFRGFTHHRLFSCYNKRKQSRIPYSRIHTAYALRIDF